MCSCTASGYFVWKAFEKIRVDGELGDKDGDDKYWLSTAFTDGCFMCLLVVIKFDHAYEFFVTFLAFKISFIRTFSVVAIQFCDIIKQWPTLHTLLRSHFYWLGWDYLKFFSH